MIIKSRIVITLQILFSTKYTVEKNIFGKLIFFNNVCFIPTPPQLRPTDLPQRQNSDNFVYLEAISPHFTRQKEIPISYENGFLFIHTDKPVYTPDQSGK